MGKVRNPFEGSSAKRPFSTGWRPPFPDLRDYTIEHPEVKPIVKKLGMKAAMDKAIQEVAAKSLAEKPLKYTWLPQTKDLRNWCSPIENQETLGSCTAQAAVGIVEYFQRRAFSKHINGSRLFVYKTTRNLMGVTGDTGAWNRNAMGALELCGCPPEKYWPYTDADPEFDEEPTAFVYALADNFEALKYVCHDPQSGSQSPAAALLSVKLFIAMGIPSVFGFWGFEEGHWEGSTYVLPYADGNVYYPAAGDWVRWGHAVVAVGYNDKKKVTNPDSGVETTGALLLRNSWGTAWGDNGYGWIPYEFVLDNLALDFWSLLSMEWVDTGKFGI